MHERPGILLVANWDSGVGYAWWLMESFWSKISQAYADQYRCHLAYPSISRIPETVSAAPIQIHERDFRVRGARGLLGQLRFLRRHRIRVIYYSDHPALCAHYLLFRLAGVKSIVIHDHTPGKRTVPSGIKRWIKWALQRVPGLSADVQIGATEFVRQRLIEVGCAPAEKCFAVPNGIPLRDVVPLDVYAEFDIPRERRVFVTVARASRYKGIEFAMRSLAATGRDDWHYLLCGDGPDLDYFKTIARELNISAQVTFAGNRSDVPSLLLSCYAAFHPSSGEVGYSLSILEAMAAGLPVIVPNDPSVSGATNRLTGVIYNDAADAVMAIVQLLDLRDYVQALGGRARDYVRERHSLEKTHALLLDAFGHALPGADRSVAARR